MEYYSLIVVFTILFDFSSCACGARHFGPNVVLGNHEGNEKFEEKPSTLRNLDVSNHNRSSTDTLPQSQKEETNYLKPMPILEDDKQSIMIETQTYDHVVQTDENTEPKEAGSIRGGGDVEVTDYAPPHEKPPIHNQEP